MHQGYERGVIMNLNNKGWGLMAFLIFAFLILMVILIVAGQIESISELYY